MKILFTIALLATIVLPSNAREKTPLVTGVKLSGYGIAQYQYNGNTASKSNTFIVRDMRISLEGYIANDFYWKGQLQFSGNTSTLVTSPKLLDVFMEWQKYDFMRIKIGQFHLPFSFESSMNAIDQSFMSFAQNISKLDGFNDRDGAQSSNGRDIGIQVQGDFLKDASNRNLLHYQVGVFNGQGINLSDVDQRKDIAGGVWVMPIKGMRLGMFGLAGSYARKGTWTDETGNEVSGVRSLPQYRYAISGEYLVNDWTFRSEYIHSHGNGFAQQLTGSDDTSATNCNLAANGNKADGIYALAIAPIIKEKMHVKARYDLYRDNASWNKARTQYEIGADYIFDKRFKISGEYAFINDRNLAKPNYNMINVEVSYKF